MMPFRRIIQRNLEKIKNLEIDVIAPSHGPSYDKPEVIVEAYNKWVYDPPKNVVVLPYISMHGSTKKMVDHFVEALVDRGITVKQFDLARTDIGKLAMALVDAATIVIGSPTVIVGPHPKVVYATYLANILRPKAKFASIIGSYGWGGRMVEQIKDLLSGLKVELLDPVVVKGFPKEEDSKALDKLADDIARKHEENKLAN
jgi:flavorubredoxin